MTFFIAYILGRGLIELNALNGMKNRIIAVGLLVALLPIAAQAQDTTRRTLSGFRFNVEVPLTDNASLMRI